MLFSRSLGAIGGREGCEKVKNVLQFFWIFFFEKKNNQLKTETSQAKKGRSRVFRRPTRPLARPPARQPRVRRYKAESRVWSPYSSAPTTSQPYPTPTTSPQTNHPSCFQCWAERSRVASRRPIHLTLLRRPALKTITKSTACTKGKYI